jgi:transposase
MGGSLQPDPSVSKAAWRNGPKTSLLSTRRFEEAGAAPDDDLDPEEPLPDMAPEADLPTGAPAAPPNPAGRMEIVLASGARIIVGADVDATALARVVETLTRL